MQRNQCAQVKNIFTRSDFALAFFLKYILRIKTNLGFLYQTVIINIFGEQRANPKDIMEAVATIMIGEEFDTVINRVETARRAAAARRDAESTATATLKIVWKKLLGEAYPIVADAVKERNRVEIERIAEEERERLAELARLNIEGAEELVRLEEFRMAHMIELNHRRAAGELVGDGPNH